MSVAERILKVSGGNILKGEVSISGAKNSTNHLLAATLLTEEDCIIHNVPNITDTVTTLKILHALGASTEQIGLNSYLVNASTLNNSTVPEDLAVAARPTIFLGALAGSIGEAILPEPVGDRIGSRPINWHMDALRKLGYHAYFDGQQNIVRADEPHSAVIKFTKNTHTGTSNTILASVRITGVTVIKNAAEEPEVDDLIAFLNSMGAKIRRTKKREITIHGVPNLHGTEHIAIPDRNEAVTYACAALISGGEILLSDVIPEHLEFFFSILDGIGAEYELDQAGIKIVFPKNGLEAVDLETSHHPGFMSDWQPMVTALLTKAKGTSTVIERVHSSRFQFTRDLARMGAKIKLFDPEIDELEKYYDFDTGEHDLSHHGCAITGPTQLHSIEARISDIRAGAALILAALSAQGESSFSRLEHLDRGYDSYVEKFRGLGAQIEVYEQ